MPLKYLGKLLFPRQPEWQRRHQMNLLVVATVVAIVLAGLIVAVMFLLNRRS
jgi:hypothetical protein